jgi:hypothetical protein
MTNVFDTTALDETPDNTNFLSPLVFKFQIRRAPTLNFFVQNVNLPGLHLQHVDQPNPFVVIPHGGDHIIYDDIMVNFKVDENMLNWLEVHNWIRDMGFPQNFEQHKRLTDAELLSGTANGRVSDIDLIICNSNRIPTMSVSFIDAFPISLSSVIFDTTLTGESYLTAAATFRYQRYVLEAVA